MMLTRRTVGVLLIGAGACLLAGPVLRLRAQEQAPNRREFSITARDYTFTPGRIEVMQDDLVKLTVESADHAYSFAIDPYKISRRIPAGGRTIIEFRADQVGEFPYYSNMTSDSRHTKMRGVLVVRRR
jgi:cytochrome c oxidase subunit 2